MRNSGWCTIFFLGSVCAAGTTPQHIPLQRVKKGSGAPSFSGIYPHLASFNHQNECGIGAVVPWAERLWWVTYAPHKPNGSDDKLYAINRGRDLFMWPGSVGGTPANRMIHQETRQLLIGPYVIDHEGNVRVIPPDVMPGRHTGIARHLTSPGRKVYYATMEEGFYEVDLKTLEVKELFPDTNGRGGRGGALIPGCHGKGFYSGQGRVVYANNGERGRSALKRPDIESGALAEWTGKGDWNVVRRNQFTEVTGPGGIRGNEHPGTDPLWSVGWDHRSLIVMLLDGGRWYSYRLPKASHCYDGAHGWNTEWPRIRDIGGRELLMTMHGMFWRFPRTFSRGNSAGLSPRSTYLMVVGDFCRWGDTVVFGCDVTAKSEFLNKRKAKGRLAAPGQSQSNIRFVRPERLDGFGAPIGRGGVWIEDPVAGGTFSEPFLFSGFRHRGVHLAHKKSGPVTFTFEIDEKGNNRWKRLKAVEVPGSGYRWCAFKAEERGRWIRVRTDRDCDEATVFFQYADTPPAGSRDAGIFDGIASPSCRSVNGGLIRVRGSDRGTLQFAADAARDGSVRKLGYYELDGGMNLCRRNNSSAYTWLKNNVEIPDNVLSIDAASVVYVDDDGKRYRLPKGSEALEKPGPLGRERIDREVCTERDIFNCCGTFYELPAENAGGFSRIRPVATHNRRIKDYCSWRGLLVISGIDDDAEAASRNPHIIRSKDEKCALWVGAVDDLWNFGRPSGFGGPWKNTDVKADAPSDPYLMTGFDEKTVYLSHASDKRIGICIEVDITGTGLWRPYKTFSVEAGETVEYRFPDAFQAYWMRAVASEDTNATVQLVYK